ncbi:MAG: FliM/FliN family flagellar motor switch protein [Candidatus Margulisiibacteriota bacterium]|nr:FliM/FliN family flagellar motor switch protein [Candidatus Margulisiibacteriota bacterium]
MVEKQASKPEIAPQKRTLKFAPAIGDWTVYKPPRVLVKKVKTGLYGFDRLSKEELNLFLFIHYNFTKEFLKRLKIDLGLSVELFTVSVEQTTYLNFLRTMTSAVVQGKIKVKNEHDPVHIFFDLAQANSIINYALGNRDLEPLNRGLTDSENRVFTTTMTEYLPKFSSAYENVIKNPVFNITSSPDIMLDSSINPNLTIASFNAEIALADNPVGKITFAYPGGMLKKLIAQYKEIVYAKPLNFARLPGSLLSKIMAGASIALGETSLTTNDIDQLEIGDVVSLETSIESPISFTVGENLKSFAQPGTKNKKYAARIVGFEERPEISIPKPELEEEETEELSPTVEEEVEEEETAEDLSAAQGAEEEEFTEEESFPEDMSSEAQEAEEEEFPEEEATEEEESEELPEEEEDFSEEDFPDEEFPEEDLSSEAQSAEDEEKEE